MTHDTSPRVYGTDHDDPNPGPEDGHEYVSLDGGPLDGQLLDVTDWPAADRVDGAALITELGTYGPGGRALYGPAADAADRWVWQGDAP